MVKRHLATAASAVKLELDRLELVERVAALQRRDVRDLPRHRAVIAYVKECATMARPAADLRAARHLYKAASAIYEKRIAFRAQSGIKWRDGGRSIALSAIIEARAECLHWRKVIAKLEAAAKIKEQEEQNRRSINRHRLRSMGLAC